MPKTARQLDQEIAKAFSDSKTAAHARARFTVQGARKGKNQVKHVESAIEADRIARRWAKKDFVITVLEQDPSTQKYHAVMVSNRKDGKMVIKILDESFARAAAH
jgi:hypothetical protein